LSYVFSRDYEASDGRAIIGLVLIVGILSCLIFAVLSYRKSRAEHGEKQIEEELTRVADRLIQIKQGRKRLTLRQIIRVFRNNKDN
jgi:hypothetical protein